MAHHSRWRACFSQHQLTEGGIGKHRNYFNEVSSPSESVTRVKVICLLTVPFIRLSLAYNARENASSSKQHKCHEGRSKASSLACCQLVAPRVGRAHGLRNEM